MKAIVYEIYGSPDVLQLKEIAKQAPGNIGILIRIRAKIVPSVDCRMRKADPFAERFFIGLTKYKRIIISGILPFNAIKTTLLCQSS